ncbi:MAG: AMP-binding protein, partial [Candidatus Binatia bacterium]
MSGSSRHSAGLPWQQQAIRARCFHPSGTFVEFKKEEIEQSIPDRFEQMAQKYPDRIAVKTKNHTLTYEELNKAANRVSRAILARRRRGEEPVALLLEMSAPLISTVLGVLKTGKIYVPVDPSLPQARITSMLEDFQAGLIMTNNQNLSLANELVQHRSYVLNIDTSDSSLSNENLGLSLSPDAIACIVYTSGLTGQPKGVVQNHRNVLHKVMRHTNSRAICAKDRLSLLYSSSASPAMQDIFTALLNGAGVYALDIKKEGVDLLSDWLISEQITVYHSAATVFRQFVETLTGKEEFPELRLIKLGSEAVYTRDVELYKKHFSPNCLFANGLGSTESGVAREYFINKETQITDNIVPVGYAVEDIEILLLDDSGGEIGVDCIGEIAIKTRYLSPGYWRKPELTQAAFIPDPGGGTERIFLTGDLGRMLPGGCLLYLGRKGSRVKIRGYSVEPVEVERALLDLDAIKQAVVVGREDKPGDQCLVAYIVPTGRPAPTISALRRALAEKLPDYMIPSALVMLDVLPLTPTGKVDRRALPAPGRTRPELESTFVAPRTPVEETLVGIWAEVVGVDQVGIQDNFFDLGGHSLAATRVISRVIKTFKVELPIKSLFESPTVADMAQVIMQNQAKKVGPEELARMLAELEPLSDEEARQRLADE